MKRLFLALLAACSSEPAAKEPEPPCDNLAIAGGCVAVGCIDCARDALACGPGTYALPGEAACHPVGACSEVEGSVYVDAAAPAGGDGSAGKPFRRIADALTAAPVDAVIAVRAGTYTEALRIDRPVTIAGACAEKVTIRGLRPDFAAIDIRTRAKLRGLSVTGPDQGILVRDGDAELDAVRVHDTAHLAVIVDILNGKTASLVVRDSLIESVNIGGVAAFGARATIERTVIRDTRMRDGKGGPGVMSQFFKGVAPTVTIRGSLIEHNHEVSIGTAGGALEIVDTLVRDTRPMADGTVGNGILAALDGTSGTLPSLRVSGSVIEKSHEVAVVIGGGEAILEKTLVRDVLRQKKRNVYGVGIQVEPGVTLTLRDCTVERASHAGIALFAARATIERTLVRNVDGAAIGVIDAEGKGSTATLERVLLLDNVHAGVLVAGSEARLTDSAVRRTAGRDGRFGDGVVGLPSGPLLPAVTASGTALEGNARAGFAMFGGALTLTGARLACNRVDLDIEHDTALTDGGGNGCGCGSATSCRAENNSLELTPAPDRAVR